MIDDPDCTNSTIRLLVFQGLQKWDTKSIFELLYDEDYIVRSAAARELQIRGEEWTFKKLQNLVANPIPYVREISAFTLGQLGNPKYPFKKQSIPLLKKMLFDDDPEVRAAAVAAFGHLGTYDISGFIEDQLIAMTSDESEEMRESLAYTLGSSSGSEKVIEALTFLLNDNSEGVRSWAATSIELLEDKNQEKL